MFLSRPISELPLEDKLFNVCIKSCWTKVVTKTLLLRKDGRGEIIFSGYANNCRVRRNKEVTRLQQTCDELDVEQKKTDIAFVAKMEREIGRQQEDLAAANTSSSRK
jgi:hypothetical protein